MLKRKIEKDIKSWIQNGNKALLVTGGRQVGKTYIIRSVLQEEKCDYIEFNLIETPQLCLLLSKSTTVDDLITNLALYREDVQEGTYNHLL